MNAPSSVTVFFYYYYLVFISAVLKCYKWPAGIYSIGIFRKWGKQSDDHRGFKELLDYIWKRKQRWLKLSIRFWVNGCSLLTNSYNTIFGEFPFVTTMSRSQQYTQWVKCYHNHFEMMKNNTNYVQKTVQSSPDRINNHLFMHRAETDQHKQTEYTYKIPRTWY